MGTTTAMVWARPEQTAFLREALEQAGIAAVGAGSPDPTKGSEVAKALGCEHMDDLRHMLSAESPDLVLLASPGAFGDQDLDNDLAVIQQAHARETAIATLEPIPAEATVISGTSWSEPIQSGTFARFVQQVPLLRYTALVDELVSAVESYGPVRSMSCALATPGVMGSLGARVFDTMDLVRTFMGIPELIDATYTSPRHKAGLHALPGRSLRDLHGIMTVHCRMGDGRGALVQLCDGSARSTLSMTIIAQEAHIRVDDEGFAVYALHGDETDRFALDPQTSGGDNATTDPTQRRLSEQLIQLTSGTGPAITRAPVDHASVLAMGHTALLSARTGQGETPDTIRRMLLEV